MRRFLLTCLGLVFCSSVSAQTYSSYPQVAPAYLGSTMVQGPPHVEFAGGVVTSSIATTSDTPTTSYSPVFNSAARVTSGPSQVVPGLAQQKAQQAAAANLRGHLNNELGGARYEGVGWSNVSPQSAVRNCCYWGARPVAQIGVSRGNDGCWYACVLYQ